MPDPETQPGSRDPRQDAGQDPSIRERLKRNPDDPDAKIDEGSDESMDASDPPATSAPGSQDPMQSSGYDPVKERANRQA
jgi:hypothetical protein